MIFYPADYWHQTLNTPAAAGQLSIGFTDTLADWSNQHLIKRGLLANCAKPKIENITPSAALCDKFPRIFSFWERAYGAAGSTQLQQSHQLAREAQGCVAAEADLQAATVAADGSVSAPSHCSGAVVDSGAASVASFLSPQPPLWRTCDMGTCDSLPQAA